MFWNLLSIEHTKNFRRYTLRIEMIFLCAFLVLAYIVNGIELIQLQSGDTVYQPAVEALKADMVWPQYLTICANFSTMFGGLLVIILVGAMTAQEYSWRTVSLQVGHGAPRLMLLTAKLVSFILPIFCLVVSPLVVGGIISAIATYYFHIGINLSQVDFPNLALIVIGIAYSLLPQAAFTFLLAVLTRSTAAAIGIGMGYFQILENILAVILLSLGGVGERIAYHLPGVMANNINSIIQKNPSLIAPSTDLPAAVLGVAVYSLVFFLLAALIFYRQDLGS
jgi:ABC-2 type transport system permease protein